MQQELRSPRLEAKSFLAGLLAVLLLALGLLAASAPLHHSLHQNKAADGNFCAICLFAKGQVDLPDVAPALVSIICLLFCGVLATSAGIPWDVDFLLPPGRAPPRFSHNS